MRKSRTLMVIALRAITTQFERDKHSFTGDGFVFYCVPDTLSPKQSSTSIGSKVQSRSVTLVDTFPPSDEQDDADGGGGGGGDDAAAASATAETAMELYLGAANSGVSSSLLRPSSRRGGLCISLLMLVALLIHLCTFPHLRTLTHRRTVSLNPQFM